MASEAIIPNYFLRLLYVLYVGKPLKTRLTPYCTFRVQRHANMLVSLLSVGLWRWADHHMECLVVVDGEGTMAWLECQTSL